MIRGATTYRRSSTNCSSNSTSGRWKVWRSQKCWWGPGYRVYYAIEGQKIILLLIGGDKSTQSKDIEKAQKFWASHKKEK